MSTPLTLDVARRLVADRSETLRASSRTPRRRRTARRGPLRRLLEWIDRTTPASGAPPRGGAPATGAVPC